MNKYKRLASNTIVLALGQFGSKFLVILMMRFYQAQLGESGYGEVGTLIDTATLLMAFATLSIGESIIRFGLDKNYRKDQVFSIGLRITFLGLLGCLLILPLLSWLTGLFPDNDVLVLMNKYSWLLFIYVFTGSIKSTVGLFVRSAGYVRLYAIDGIFTTVMNILFNLLLLWAFNLGVVGYMLSVILADVCSVIFLSFMANLKKYFLLFGLDKNLINAMLRFCLPMIPTTVMWWITNASDSFFVSGMLGFEATGIYKAAYRLPNIIALVSGIFSQAWNMSAITENNSRTVAKFYSNVFSTLQSAVYVMAAGMLFVIRPVLMIICEPAFQISYIYTPLLVMSVVFTCFSTFMGSVYVAAKKSVNSMVTACAGAGLNLILNAVLIGLMGLHGAALSTFISYLVIFIARAVDSRKFVFMDINLPKMITNSVLLLIMSFVIFFVENLAAYYIILAVIFIAVTALNFNAFIKGIKLVLNKKRQ
ncbi:MAG: oligosaccharide flippase family protein [Ruminiclostridium sp.]